MQCRASHLPHPKRKAFSLGELLAILLMVAIVAAILFPLFARPREGWPHSSCQSNMKQIGLSFLGYIQDYDGCFPPSVTYYRADDGVVYPQDWAFAYKPTTNPLVTVPPTVEACAKNQYVTRCPDVKNAKTTTYLYNDLAAGANQEAFAGVSQSILLADGEDQMSNVGHAYTPGVAAHPAVGFDESGTCAPGNGATVKTAPTRHRGGANYCFADGHVKWWKPESVYFPDVNTNSRSHKDEHGVLLGPDPAGKMEWQGRIYGATFHTK